MNNQIIIFDEDQNEEIVSEIEGLTIKFKGKNNVVKIEKGSIFKSSRMVLSRHCEVNIEKTDKYGIRSLSADLNNYCKLKIGKNFRCVSLRISAQSEENLSVIIGDNCMFATRVLLRPTDGHSIYDVNTKELLNKGEDIIIGNHVWSGLNTLYLKGAEVFDNSIVGANSVVNKKFHEENVVIAGSPARIVKRGVNWTIENPGKYLKKLEESKNPGKVAQIEKADNPGKEVEELKKKRRFWQKF